MAKFGKSIVGEDEVVAPPVVVIQEQVVSPAPVPVSPIQQPAPVDNTLPPDFNNLSSAEPKAEEHWAKSYWRPAMGWLYMLICLVDFVVFPAISMFIPILTKIPYVAWQSLTLSNGGLIHMAFGAILGVAAYGRTQEKINK